MMKYVHGKYGTWRHTSPHPKRCNNGCKACSMKSQAPDDQQRARRMLSDMIEHGEKYRGGDFYCRKLSVWITDEEYKTICIIGCGEYK